MNPLLKSLLMIALFAGCAAKGGTGSGNPSQGLPTNDGVSQGTTAVQLAHELCRKVSSCFSESQYSGCLSSALNAAALPSKFGSDEGTLLDVANAETSSKIVPRGPETRTCIGATRALSCMQVEVVAAFDPTLPNPYEHLDGMVPVTDASGCSKIFVPLTN